MGAYLMWRKRRSVTHWSFFNAEYCIGEHGTTLLEVNCRAALCFERLYNQALGFSTYHAGLRLCLGQHSNLTVTPLQYGAQFNVVTDMQGDSSDLFDYDLPAPAPLRVFLPEHTAIRKLSEHGTVIAQFELFGESYDAIRARADTYRHRALKRTSLSPTPMGWRAVHRCC